jgi:hypothetical protein
MTTVDDNDHLAERLVVQLAFDELPAEQVAVLFDDDHIVDTFNRARSIVAAINCQNERYKARAAAGEPVDPEWRARAWVVKGRVERLCICLRPKVADRNRRRNSQPSEFSRLRIAILRHEAAVTADYEPRPADIELWAALNVGESERKTG